MPEANLMRQEIEVTALLLDITNPRMEEQPGHRDAIRALFTEYPKDMVNLAEDIGINRLNPLENLGVSPFGKDRYLVREGNRRVAVLCVLYSPDLVKGVLTGSLYKRLRGLSEKFLANPIEKVECEVLPEDQWSHWITLRHTGPNEGRGLVSWGAVEKARYLHRTGAGKKAIELQFIDWYKAATETDEGEQSLLRKVPASNLKRLLDDSGVRKRFGITLQNGLVFSAYPPDEIFKWARRIVHDLGEKKIKVKDIYDSKKISIYLDKFSPHELPDPSKELKSPIPIEPISTPEPAKKEKKVKPPKPWSIRELNISPKHSRLRDIILELQNISIEKNPNIHSVMLRVFVEMSVQDYLAHHKLTAPNGPKLNHPTFGSSVATAVDHLEKSGAMKKAELVPARKLAGTSSALYSAQTLHQFVHNKSVHPNSNDIVTLWKDLGPFIVKLHER